MLLACRLPFVTTCPRFALVLSSVAYPERASISMAAPVMTAELEVNDAQAAYVFSAFTLAFALVEVPNGRLVFDSILQARPVLLPSTTGQGKRSVNPVVN